MTKASRVGVIMGSDSDWSVMTEAADALAEFDVAYEVGVVSAHRTPGRMLDYPLGDTDATVPVTVMANVLGAAQTPTMTVDERLHHLFARMPDARVHLYGKGERPGRKVGHINFLGDHVAELANLRERAELAAHWLSHGQWTDGWDPHG